MKVALTGARTLALTMLTMVAFAANSVLCRLALAPDLIDAKSFTTVRILSGACMLLVLSAGRGTLRSVLALARWDAAVMLFLYAVCFSLAYVSLAAGTGALILFGAVQVTMISSALWLGERPGAWQWAGLAAALTGLVYLVLPGLTAPSPVGSALMAAAGVAWGVYSLLGRRSTKPLASTTGNFVYAAPLTIAVSLIWLGDVHWTTTGVVVAVCSGALASGVGYVIWYAALAGLTATRAATVQLSVPVLAAVGGVLFLAEGITTRLVLSSVLILGGVALAVLTRNRAN